MFVYQNKDGQICVTFADNKPVENPEFVIAIDKEAKALYAVAGEVVPFPANVEEDEDEVVEDEVPSTDEPEVPAEEEENEEV